MTKNNKFEEFTKLEKAKQFFSIGILAFLLGLIAVFIVLTSVFWMPLYLLIAFYQRWKNE